MLEQLFREVLARQILLMSFFSKLRKELLVVQFGDLARARALLGNICLFGYPDELSGFKKDAEIRWGLDLGALNLV